MPIDFPAGPTTGQVYAYQGNSWIYNGSGWDTVTPNYTLPAPSGNVIINGGFDIWQRGTTFNSIAGGTYFADRWTTGFKDAGVTLNVSQQTFTPGAAPVAGYEGTFFARIANTGNGTYYIGQKIEDVRTFAGQAVTLSYWARVSTGTFTPSRVFFSQEFGSGGSSLVDNIGVSTPTYTTTWQRFTQTVAIPSISGKTIGTGSHLFLLWQNTMSSNISVDIWGVQLEAGAVATPFKRNAPSLQAELAACQRYYQRFLGGVGCGLTGVAPNATQMLMNFSLPVTMRANVSASGSGQLCFSDQYSADPITANGTLDYLQGATPSGGRILINGFSGLTVARYYSTPGGFAGGGYLQFSAEL